MHLVSKCSHFTLTTVCQRCRLFFFFFFHTVATVTATNDTVTQISQQESRSAPSSARVICPAAALASILGWQAGSVPVRCHV